MSETNTKNTFGQPVGDAIPAWSGARAPERRAHVGRTCRLEPIAMAHADALWQAVQLDPNGLNWTYSLTQAPTSRSGFESFMEASIASADPLYFTVIDAAAKEPVGWATYMRLQPEMGVIEVGSIHYTEKLKRTVAGTEAMYLMMRHAFEDLGYRRYEWKCDALNEPSRRAAKRYGFTYEGTFRQAMVSKQRNRDTAWFSIIDAEWPSVKSGFEAWLSPDNFSSDGRQIRSMADCRG